MASPFAFQTKVDIANRALQKVGAERIAAFTDDSKAAAEASFCYDKLRRAELRENLWRFAIKRCALRPLDVTSRQLTFGAWSSGATYGVGDVIQGSDGYEYQSVRTSNLNHDPTTTIGYWQLYSGPDTALQYPSVWSSGATYSIGAVVQYNSVLYSSLINSNTNHQPDVNPADWGPYTGSLNFPPAFYMGEFVYDLAGNVYISIQNGNVDIPPTANWLLLSTQPTILPVEILYPIGSGPLSISSTRNAYRLPLGYLREAPRDPRAGSYTTLGAPTNLSYTDWEMEGDYIVSSSVDPILYRYVADVQDVTLMDDMFCEGLSCRMGMEMCETLTQSVTKIGVLGKQYVEFMGRARLVQAIEQGPTESPLDDWLQVRN